MTGNRSRRLRVTETNESDTRRIPRQVLCADLRRDVDLLHLGRGEGDSRAHATRCSIGAAGSLRSLRSEEHTSELQSLAYLVCRLLLEKKKASLLRASTGVKQCA